ncbi:unnamed protein product [Cladocopium goreaui]|uniref:Uncharacterized protein n=1 Tax=Cladocopium goreaui TaxID=2562237 RepID=A0A9P1BSM3_9DINO|nr:unnamed protein product [Cladocopium goreaui]
MKQKGDVKIDTGYIATDNGTRFGSADRSAKAAPRAKGQPGTKSASATSPPKARRKAPAEEVFRPPRLLPRMKKPVEPPPLETPGSASGVSTTSLDPERCGLLRALTMFLDDDAPQHEENREDSSPEVVEVPDPAPPSAADTAADVEATVRELMKLAQVVEVADGPPEPTPAPAPAPAATPAEPLRPARMAPGRGPSEVEATLRELMKLAEVVEAADLDDQPYPTAAELAGSEAEVEESDGFQELEAGEEELQEDDEILSDVEGDAVDDRPAWHPSGDDVDLSDIPLLS